LNSQVQDDFTRQTLTCYAGGPEYFIIGPQKNTVMILIKMGGSIITDKTQPLTPRKQDIERLAGAISEMEEPVIVVHGGGSFGHYWSVRYDMHTEARDYDTTGVATVKNSMVRLNLIVLEALLKEGNKPYVVSPSGFMAGPNPIESRVEELARIAGSGMIPVTYGDALWYGGEEDKGARTYILSGDKIMTHLAGILRPRLCIFALSEDGLYRDMKSRTLVDVVSTRADTPPVALQAESTTQDPFCGPDGRMDVTGGMARKVGEATAISCMGIDVAFVNGRYTERLLGAASGEAFLGTLFEGVGLKEK